MERKGIRKEKVVIRDSAEDFNPVKAKKKRLDEAKLKTETVRSDTKAGMGNKRKRPIPKEEKKRKKPRTDEETKSETGLGQYKQKERKKQRGGEEAHLETKPNGDDKYDTATTTAKACRDEQDDDDRDSTSEEDETDEDESMDCAEETIEDPSSDTSLPTSMLQPEGSNTQHEYSKNIRLMEQRISKSKEITHLFGKSQHEKKPVVQRERRVFDEADTASLKTTHDIRKTGREMPGRQELGRTPHQNIRPSIPYNESETTPPKRSKNKKASYQDYHTMIRQRPSQQPWQDKATPTDELKFPLYSKPTVETKRTYTGSTYTSKNRIKRERRVPSREDRVSSSHTCKKSCILVLILLIVFVVALFTFIPKMDIGKTDVVQTVVRDMGSFLFPPGHAGCVKRERSDRFDVLIQEQDILRQQHPSLDESKLSIIAGASFDHVDEHRELVRPVVLLLVGKHGDKTDINDVAINVAKMYAKVFSPEHHENDVVGIVGAYLEKSSSDEVRKEVHGHIEEGFRGCSNVVLITDVDRLPPCSVILFHAYCDNDSAPHKDAVFIFTMTLNTKLPEDTQDIVVEKAVQAQLNEGWSRCPEEFPPAKLVAMHSRIGNNIVII